ncbi:MAG: DUF1929 domain-containing protein [Acidobacteriia bacterium]|nr:DUF1929 domain-containing protein [Terriglobia bacterium]
MVSTLRSQIRFLRFAVVTLLMLLIALPALSQHAKPAEPGQTAVTQTQSGKQAGKTDPSVVGSWTAPIPWGVTAIHAALLHTGKAGQVLGWWYPLGSATNSPARLLDLATGTVTDVTIPLAGDFFCSGQTILPDGRVLVTGGLVGNPYPHVLDKGHPMTAIFDPVTATWSQGPNMNFARWYPTNMELASGKILTLTGKNETATAIVLPMEVFDPATSKWTTLPPSANITPYSDTYLKMKQLPSGKIFQAGANAQTRLFSPATNRWVNTGKMNFGTRYHGAAVLLPGLNKVFTAGGTLTYPGGGATATAEVIDLSVATPQWSFVAPMNIPRYNANLLLLADGTVLVVGGAQVSKYLSPVQVPELYDPVANTWTEMATQTAPRTYHSTALLLPDGTVWSGGSDDPQNVNTGNAYEIFSPPYLFKGPRPTITSAPTALGYNQSFTIVTPDAANVTSVALIKPGATTHDNEMDQRYVTLSFTKGNGQLTATSPLNGNYAPPGWYMLVILNSNGVPSLMPFLQLM